MFYHPFPVTKKQAISTPGLFHCTQLKLAERDRVSVREIAREEKRRGEQTQDNNETESDSKTLLVEKCEKKQEEEGKGQEAKE